MYSPTNPNKHHFSRVQAPQVALCNNHNSGIQAPLVAHQQTYPSRHDHSSGIQAPLVVHRKHETNMIPAAYASRHQGTLGCKFQIETNMFLATCPSRHAQSRNTSGMFPASLGGCPQNQKEDMVQEQMPISIEKFTSFAVMLHVVIACFLLTLPLSLLVYHSFSLSNFPSLCPLLLLAWHSSALGNAPSDITSLLRTRGRHSIISSLSLSWYCRENNWDAFRMEF